MSIINKFLNKRITDKSFKIMFYSVALIVVGSVLFLLYQSQNLKQSYESIAKQKSITILDESGNVITKKLYETNEDIATLFGINYVKKTLGYSYLNYNRIINYIKVYSTKEVQKKIRKNQLNNKNIKQLKILNATNIATIENFKLKNKKNSNKSFIIQLQVKKELVSESINKSERFYVEIQIDFRDPTNINSSGIYVTDYNIEKWNPKKHPDIFKGK